MAEPRAISEELERYGYVFSWKRSAILCIGTCLFTFALGRFYHLNTIPQVILCIGTLLMMPLFIRSSLKNQYNQHRFSDLNIYMEQYLYSFQKTGKVLTTLEDIQKLFETGDMRSTIDRAIECITTTYGEMDVERKALQIIEAEYPYSGLKSIHSFSLDAEQDGGDYTPSVMLLLESRRMWADRNYELLKEKRQQRVRVILSILTTLLICSMIYILGAKMNLDVASNPVSQVVTLIVLLTDLLIFYMADKRFSQDDAMDDSENVDDIVEAQKRIANYSDKWIDRMGKKAAMKTVSRQIEKDFPKWLMSISLLLQTENVQVAIIKSYDEAPIILKEPLRKLIGELQSNPSGMVPYVNFLGEYTLPEVRSSMKMLYSLSEGTGGDASAQIADIIRRNQTLMDRADRLRNEDAMAGMYALFLAPQITGGFKLIVDMVLFFVIYLAQIGQMAG